MIEVSFQHRDGSSCLSRPRPEADQRRRRHSSGICGGGGCDSSKKASFLRSVCEKTLVVKKTTSGCQVQLPLPRRGRSAGGGRGRRQQPQVPATRPDARNKEDNSSVTLRGYFCFILHGHCTLFCSTPVRPLTDGEEDKENDMLEAEALAVRGKHLMLPARYE